MNCLYCGGNTRVINSRHQKRSNHIWRRRQCVSCNAIVTTIENPELVKSVSIIKNKHVEPFSRDKLFLSIYESLKHRKTAVADAGGLTDTVVSKLLTQTDSPALSREQIVTTTLDTLNHFDKPAATHYQAFHTL